MLNGNIADKYRKKISSKIKNIEKDIKLFLENLEEIIKNEDITHTVFLLRRGYIFLEYIKSHKETNKIPKHVMLLSDNQFLFEVFKKISEGNIDGLRNMKVLLVDDAITKGSQCTEFLKRLIKSIINGAFKLHNTIEKNKCKISEKKEIAKIIHHIREIDDIDNAIENAFKVMINTTDANFNLNDDVRNLISNISGTLFPSKIIISCYILNNSNNLLETFNQRNSYLGLNKIILSEKLTHTDYRLIFYLCNENEQYLRTLDRFIWFISSFGSIIDWDHVQIEITPQNEISYKKFWKLLEDILRDFQKVENIYDASIPYLNPKVIKVGIFGIPHTIMDDNYSRIIRDSVTQAKIRFLIHINNSLTSKTKIEEIKIKKILVIPILNVKLSENMIEEILKQCKLNNMLPRNYKDINTPCSIPEISYFSRDIAVFCLNLRFAETFLTSYLGSNRYNKGIKFKVKSIKHNLVSNILKDEKLLNSIAKRINQKLC